MNLMRRIRVLSLPVLAALPSGAARAACNPTGTDVCCERTETREIGGVEWPEADGVEVSRTCTAAAFELKGLREGRVWGTNVTAWVSSDTGVVCPPALRTPFEAAVEPDVVWEMTVGGTNRVSGSGTLAESPDPVAGSVQCVFTVRGETAGCGSRERTYEGEALVPATGFSLPDVVGRNDLVEPCADHTVRVGTIEELLADEEDLSRLKQWLPSPDAVAAVLYSETPGRLRVLAADGDELRDGCEYPEVPPDAPVWLEGVSRSETPGDARAALSVLSDGIWCEASATTTVVSVEFDAACYNRMDPYPEVAVTEVSGLTPGGEALVRYAALPDVADPEGVAGEARFAVPETPGTYEWRTPVVRNRFGNEGWTTVRCTVRREADGTLSASWGSAGPSHRATVGPPEGCTADVRIGDALSETPEEAVAALDLRPGVALPEAHGTRPDYELSGVRIFRKAPTQWRTNELAMTELGVSALWAEHRGVTRASAVGLELSCDSAIPVNDRFPEGDPGEDAETDRSPVDPDFGMVALTGLPDCIRSASYTWTVTDDRARLVLVDLDGSLVVATSWTGRMDAGHPLVFPAIEGRGVSLSPDDAELVFRMTVDGDASNPPAFRGKELSARCRFTVFGMQWETWTAQAGAAPGRRRNLLTCDLDLRPAVLLDAPAPSYGRPLTVTGTVRSMSDVVLDVRVNGEPVPLSEIMFLGQSGDALTNGTPDALAWGMEPPYEVRFEHELPAFTNDLLRIEAFGTVNRLPGVSEWTVEWTDSPEEGDAGLAEEAFRSPEPPDADMEAFYNGDQPFLHALHIVRPGGGAGVLVAETPETNLLCVAVGDGAYRSELPVVFLSGRHGSRLSLPGPGILWLNDPGTTLLATYGEEPFASAAELFPCQLSVLPPTGAGCDDADEWWMGNASGTNAQALVRVDDPFLLPFLPDNARLSVTASFEPADTNAPPWEESWEYDRHSPPSAAGVPVDLPDPGRLEVRARLWFPATAPSRRSAPALRSGSDGTVSDRSTLDAIDVDLDVDSDNDGTIERNDGFEDSIEEREPGRIVPVGMRQELVWNIHGCLNPEDSLILEQTAGNGTLELVHQKSNIKLSETQCIQLKEKTTGSGIVEHWYVRGTKAGPVTLRFSVRNQMGTIRASDTVQILVIPPIAVAPGGGKKAAIWCSPLTGCFLDPMIDQLKIAGWTVDLFCDDDMNDLDVGPCTLDNFQKLRNYGFVYIVAHGNKGVFSPVLFPPTPAGKAAADRWRGSEDGMLTKKSGIPIWESIRTVHEVVVCDSWLVANWKPALDKNQSIVVFDSCHSKDANNGGLSTSEASGGRLRFGFHEPSHGWDAITPITHLLKAMNGNDPPDPDTPDRNAKSALPRIIGYYNDPQRQTEKPGEKVISIIRYDGALNTTLCPAPLAHLPRFPNSTTEPGEGFGCLLFDTTLDPSVSTDRLVSSNGGRIENSYWIKCDRTTFGIGFHFKKSTNNMSVTIDLTQITNKGNNGGRRAVPSRIGAKNPEPHYTWEF